MKATFFRSPSHLRKWFDEHHTAARELWVGYFKKGSGKPSVTWPESVDEALCVGWIDGIRKRLDEESYMIRFTPRGPRSIWSAVNIRRTLALAGEGRMKPAGLRAFDARRENRSGIYSYEQRGEQLEEPYRSMLKKKHGGLVFLSGSTDLVQESRRLVGGQRQEGRDPARSPGQAHQAFGARDADPAVHARRGSDAAAQERDGLT